jgi:pilus assembly protein CpaB
MKPKSLLLLLVAGACGLVAAVAVTQHMAGKQVGLVTSPGEPRKPVVVALADQEAGTQLKPEMLKVVELPAKDLPEGVYSDPAEVTGQTLRFPVFKGELLLAGKLGERGLAHLNQSLPAGTRAATVRVDDETAEISALITPGNFVDVFWLPQQRPELGLSVVRLLQNVRVLAVGLRIDSDDSESAAAKDARSKQQNFTLLVTTEQFHRLAAATSNGRVRLALRGKGDTSVEELDEAKLDRLLGLTQPEVVRPIIETAHVPEAQSWEVEIWNGKELTIELFSVPETLR